MLIFVKKKTLTFFPLPFDLRATIIISQSFV